MADETPTAGQAAPAEPRWRPLGAIERRVLGVLAEKAKTTPDIYPMSVNAVRTGCNQKSNRAPLMQLEEDDVQQSLDRLREAGAVVMIQGYGRVSKYKHLLYEWLGVDKVELSVMTELLLRGPQTEGELRGRASRMDEIADLPALRTILTALKARGLVVPLTPEGRGHVITHALYPPREFEHLKAEHGQAGAAALQRPDEENAARPAAERTWPPGPPSPMGTPAAPAQAEALAAMQRELDEVRAQLVQLREQISEISAEQQRMAEEIRRLGDASPR